MRLVSKSNVLGTDIFIVPNRRAPRVVLRGLDARPGKCTASLQLGAMLVTPHEVRPVGAMTRNLRILWLSNSLLLVAAVFHTGLERSVDIDIEHNLQTNKKADPTSLVAPDSGTPAARSAPHFDARNAPCPITSPIYLGSVAAPNRVRDDRIAQSTCILGTIRLMI